ncbi:MAG: hypothetical protein CL846_06675 [Crocinitomicaceae bacterium]|nr:hypothetical protein [Crocinitomicaceae bacterium]|tara:strand:+ start:1354 stop:1845 length:492 start_codon:yes stop_codon:yes gene_type:complete
MINENDIELIDNYLEGKLSSVEIEAFEKRLIKDVDFKKEFDIISSIGDAFQKVDLKKELDQIEQQLNNENPYNIENSQNSIINFLLYKNRSFSIAAGFALLIFGGYFFYNFNSTTKSNNHNVNPVMGDGINDKKMNNKKMEDDTISFEIDGNEELINTILKSD